MSEEDKQRLKEYQKSYHRAKNLHKNFILVFFTLYKMEAKILIFGKVIHKNKHLTIGKVDINRTVFLIKIHMVKRVHLSTLLGIQLMLFNHYA